MIQHLQHLDDQLFIFFNGLNHPSLDLLMMELTGKYIWIVFYIVLAALLFNSFGWKRGLAYTMLAIAAVAMADQICGSLIRPMICRMRPSNPDNPVSEFANIVNGYRSGRYGFPSAHAGNTMALATFLILTFRSRGLTAIILIWALLHSYTRLYLGVHYPGDLLVGGMIGIICGVACRYAGILVTQRWFPSKGDSPAETPSVDQKALPPVNFHYFKLSPTGLSLVALIATILWAQCRIFLQTA